MKSIELLIVFLVIAILGSSCTKEEPPTADEMLVGKWVITEVELLGSTGAGDGSYLIFDACSGQTSCTGWDYSSDDDTTASLTYTLASDASTLTIADTIWGLTSGESWDATWDILELTETRLRMIGDAGIFGTIKYEFDKK
ncbi:hypothetical protein JYT74_02195 [Crocinitomix catalasitica]|nr:hypothetical protein [Crocinitomix catalasitica]